MSAASTDGAGAAARASAPAMQAVGVVVPAHNEEALLGSALAALALATEGVRDVPVHAVVVLDGCGDRSGLVARSFVAGWPGRLDVVEQRRSGVGRSRRAGVDHLLASFPPGLDPGQVWVATTDADSRVPPGWLAYQLARAAEGTQAWAGTVRVGGAEAALRDPAAMARFLAAYASGHPHFHGANLGMTARAYQAAGGFRPRTTGEDRAIVEALEAAGVPVHYDDANPVLTSARRDARAPAGFASALGRYEAWA